MAAIDILINALTAFFGFGGLLAWLILLLGWKFFTRPIPVPPGLCEFCGHPIPEVGPVCVECGQPPGQSITPTPRSITIARRVMALALVVIAADVMSFSYRSTTADGQRQLVGNWQAIIINLVLFTPIPLVALASTYFAMRNWTRAFLSVLLIHAGTLVLLVVVIAEIELVRPIAPVPVVYRTVFFLLDLVLLAIGSGVFLLATLLYLRWMRNRTFSIPQFPPADPNKQFRIFDRP